MANTKIRWVQKVAGREEGHVEVVEIDTEFMRGCLANRRFEIVVDEPKPKPAAPKAKKDGGVEAEGRTWV